MYDIRPLKKLDQKIQEEIEGILEKYRPLLNKAIAKQLRPTDKLYVGMGTAFIENKKGECIAEKFSSHVLGYAYRNNFDTGILIDEINVERT